jgi:hypothetical protein
MIDREPLQGAPTGAHEPGVASSRCCAPFQCQVSMPKACCLRPRGQAQPSGTGIWGMSVQMAAVGSLTARCRPFEVCVARRTDAGSPFRSRQMGNPDLTKGCCVTDV